MSIEIEDRIGAEVERSFDDEPPLRDPLTYAARGRRVRRQRRLAGGAIGVAAVAVVATVAMSGSSAGDRPGRGVEPAGTTTGQPARVTATVPVDPRTEQKCAAGLLGICDAALSWDDLHFAADGTLLRGSKEVRVTGYYADVITGAYDASAAVEVTLRGRTSWVLLTTSDTLGSSGMESAPPDPTRTFDQWVQDSATDGSGGWFSYHPDLDGPGEGATPR
jgi:hypothetical protein